MAARQQYNACTHAQTYKPNTYTHAQTHRGWVRIPAIVYGTHVATTLVPILAEFLFNSSKPKLMAALIYSPWLLLPLELLCRMVLRPYPDTVQAKLRSKMQ